MIEHMIGLKGLQSRPPRAMYLIKQAKTCGTCRNCYTVENKIPRGYVATQSTTACHVFNCKVDKTEWCKHHKAKS